ncbi:transcription initiation factor TFIID subunit 4B isoform X2 [Xenopus laevis]|uniref:Transcription initiation factor TFIID subunit 4B isoform X2 n=1 Tax=Xenopus laevis TaxID=8355 RepID=A0A8J1L2M2_XENLA|nr:transcription initiation factor TFIID subunit 4B isoform X2 [Xenopus laevis]
MHTNQGATAAPALPCHGVPAPGRSSLFSQTFPAAPSPDLPAKSVQTAVSIALAPVSSALSKVAPVLVTSQAAKVRGGLRMTAPQQVMAAKAPQTTAIQIPAGTVLVRSSTGQLMLVSQQTLARAQAQNPGAQVLTNLTNSTVKTTPLTTISIAPNFQRSPSLQTSLATNSVVKVTPSLGARQSAPVSSPTVVRICTPSAIQTTTSVSSTQGASTVVIKAPGPAVRALTNISSTSATSVSSTGSVEIPATSIMGPGTSSITVLPISASTPVITPITMNTCTSAVIPSASVKPSVSQNPIQLSSAVSVRTTSPSSIPSVKIYAPSSTLATSTCGSAIKLKTTNLYITTTAAGTCSSVSTSNTIQASSVITPVLSGNCVPQVRPAQGLAKALSGVPNGVPTIKSGPPKMTQTTATQNSPEILDNVKKCKNFLATLIKLASSGPQSPTMGQNVKNLVKSLLDSDIEPEEFTAKLYKELKSSPQPYLVPFLKKSLPALRRQMPNSQEFIMQCGHQTPQATNSVSLVKIIPTSSLQTGKQVCSTTINANNIKQQTSTTAKPISTVKTVNLKQVQPPGGTVKQVSLYQNSGLAVQKPGEKRVSLNALIHASHLPPASIVKQIAIPGNKVISIQAAPLPIKESGITSFREEDDINDVTSMAGVNLIEESACILAANSELVGAVIRSCKDEPFLFTSALQNRILDIGKRHDIKELNSDVMNLVSHATQERLRGLIEKLTLAAQHRSTNYKQIDRYLKYSDVRAQLKFLEQLEHLEKQRRNEEEREMLLRAAKSRSNREDPEQLKLKQKAKELQQMELEQIQYREANLTALAAIGPRKKRPLDSLCLRNAWDETNASGSTILGLSKSLLVPRITRVSLRDLIFCMEQERGSKHSLSLYRALLK